MRSPQYGKKDKPVAPNADYAFRGNGKSFTPAVHKVTVKTSTVTKVIGETSKLKIQVLHQTVVDPMAKVHTDSSMWGNRAVGLHGPNAALPTKRIRYLEPKTVVYSDGTRGAACLLNMHHKSGYAGLKVEGQRKRRMPTVTKRYAVAKQ